MDIVLSFITILAWVFGILSAGYIIRRVSADFCYSNAQEMLDKGRGLTRAFPIVVPGIITIICWAWIFST